MKFVQNFDQALAGAETVPYSYRVRFLRIKRLDEIYVKFLNFGLRLV